MLSKRVSCLAALLALSIGAAQATSVSLSDDGQWHGFVVSPFDAVDGSLSWIDGDDSLSPDFGSILSYTFSVASGSVATLSVVDAGFYGDTFTVYANGVALGETSSVPVAEFDALADTLDPEQAWADARYSRASYTLGAGTWTLTGTLLQSLLIEGEALNATSGGVRLSISAVPEPDASALAVAAAGALLLLSRRLPRR